MENRGSGDQTTENGLSGVQAGGNGAFWSHAMDIGFLRQCAVCEYDRRPCSPNCVFRLSLPGTSQGREDYARCVLVNGDNHLHNIVSSAPPSRQRQREVIDSEINEARRTFDESVARPYSWILVNLYSPFPWIRRYVPTGRSLGTILPEPESPLGSDYSLPDWAIFDIGR